MRMSDKAADDDQNLWRSVFTTDGGWSPDVAFADHLSAGAPALAQVGGTLYCVHRGGHEGKRDLQGLAWTSFTPAAARPYVAALETAAKPLAEGSSPQQIAAWEEKLRAAGAALDQARRWTSDTLVDDHGETPPASGDTPALVDDNGTLRMVYAFGLRGSPWPPQLFETTLDTGSGAPRWTNPNGITHLGLTCIAPVMAVLDGQVHLVHLELDERWIGHMVRGADGTWQDFTRPDGTKPDYIRIEGDHLKQEWEEGHGMAASTALAAHDGRLHLLHRTAENPTTVIHSVFDGTDWKETADFEAETGRTAALASFDGVLHAVVPAGEDTLLHRTWTSDGGWTDGTTTLTGHPSTYAPGLLAFKDGPAGQEREALLMVHRGVDPWRPPTPPPVPTPKTPPGVADVSTRGETVHGPSETSYGVTGWSRILHHVAATPATLKDGSRALIASWYATAEYYWLAGYYLDNATGVYQPRIDYGGLWLKKDGDINFLRDVSFRGSMEGGFFRFDTVFADLEPGTYRLSLSSETKKAQGYWYASTGKGVYEDPDTQRWARVQCNAAAVTITL